MVTFTKDPKQLDSLSQMILQKLKTPTMKEAANPLAKKASGLPGFDLPKKPMPKKDAPSKPTMFKSKKPPFKTNVENEEIEARVDALLAETAWPVPTASIHTDSSYDHHPADADFVKGQAKAKWHMRMHGNCMDHSHMHTRLAADHDASKDSGTAGSHRAMADSYLNIATAHKSIADGLNRKYKVNPENTNSGVNS